MRGLYHQRQAQPCRHIRGLRIRRQHFIRGRGYAGSQPHQLGAPFIHRQRARHHATTGVRDTHHFERTLYRAVFTKTTVQCNEHAIKPLCLQLLETLVPWIEGARVDTLALQGGQYHVAAAQRNLPFR